MKNNYCVIMAGGVGSRFWPLSRQARPKQFLDILGTGRTLIQQTFDRFASFIPVENILVVTSVRYKDLVKEQLPELQDTQILLEPLRRNTAPCVAYASYKIKIQNPQANIIVAPSDHLIIKEEEFLRQIKHGLDFVEQNDVLLTLGIKPSRPETGYGYIQVKEKVGFKQLDNLYQVKTFTEKPNLEMAKIFVDSGEFFWNSGIFLWSLQSILSAFDKHLNDVSSLFAKGLKLYDTDDEVHFINKTYSECQGISIDYGVMEKAQNVYVLTADFGWNDLGTWGSLYDYKEKDANGNVILGENVLTYDLNNCIVNLSKEKVAVLQGLDGYIIAESNDTLMICRKEDEQQIKQFVTDVRIKKGDSLV
ncbi:mannose-1-phosphate guanylyltransferase (GDP) [Mariniphaga anaerophila]|uniref:mannose-1-phosphate guanylyltransferase n=1 Tax=Mariniphaga anaerophila TaxID=1484053 RepID=A0A1M5B7V6_9BACT|nr:mannose-1-phosphate guanylyltransferase [Mariniphaga anaerophila]SHF38604.1 mannose-1-phosphate guanylyltransferase (GDP) [Mariniphaga anaerophila]